MRGLLAGKPLGQAGIEAGYTRETVQSKGYRLLARQHWAELLAKAGLDDETLVNKYLRRLLEGRITKYFAHEGKVVDKRQMISHEATAKGLDLSFRLLDALPRAGKEEEDPNTPGPVVAVKINVIPSAHARPGVTAGIPFEPAQAPDNGEGTISGVVIRRVERPATYAGND